MDYNTINDSMQEEIEDIKACIEKYLESDIALIEKVSKYIIAVSYTHLTLPTILLV